VNLGSQIPYGITRPGFQPARSVQQKSGGAAVGLVAAAARLTAS
jgi:hypothetical protein